MDSPSPFTFTMVGGGLTATSTLCQLVDRLEADGQRLSRKLSIVVFEKNGAFGPGLPHNEQVVLPFHITNMRAEDMSVRVDRPGDFQAWVQEHPEVPEALPADPATEADDPKADGLIRSTAAVADDLISGLRRPAT